MKYITFKCPKCGKKLKVEETSTSFFCLHCGTKITLEEDDYYYYDVEEDAGEGLLDKLFWNIGGKIKVLTKICFVFEVFLSAIGALSLIFLIDKWYSVFLALFAMAIGFLVSWVSCFFMYGLGELIETNGEIARTTATIQSKQDRILSLLSEKNKREEKTVGSISAPNQYEV